MQAPATPRVPPRFVPTLTEVVKESGQTDNESSDAATVRLTPSVSTSAARMPAPLPALPAAPAKPFGAPSAAAGIESAASPHTAAIVHTETVRPTLSKDFEELLVHRVMQRVDISLDIRLRGAIATAVEEQTRSIVPRLREEIEAVVRHAVYEAVADELAADLDPPPL